MNVNFEELAHFSPWEFFVTEVQCIHNLPNQWKHIENIYLLAKVLDEIREEFGAPIKVTSGFRTPYVNCEVGGVPDSFHQFGRAADITCSRLDDFRKLCDICKRYEFTEYIEYPQKRFIHLAI